jgi:hypothetical protein
MSTHREDPATRFSSRRLAALLILGIALGACRSRPAPSPAPNVWPHDEYCWWTNVRTTLPLDSVGQRFSSAFTSLGLAPVVSRRLGDTVLVRGGPTPRTRSTGRARYASRMVAYQVGDSTRFRWYWSIAPLDNAAMTAADSASAGGRGIGFCGDVGKAVAIHGIGSREPTSDDSLAVWRRVP